MTDAPRIVIITRAEMRSRFNTGGYIERIRAGDLQPRIRRDAHPSQPLASVPHCTRSQFVAYYDTHGARIVDVHQYLLPDGTIGGSGIPDPKRIFEGETLYIVADAAT